MHTVMTTRRLIIDGIDKGRVYKLKGRWHWQRGVGSAQVESFGRHATLRDVESWALKCTNGARAVTGMVRETETK